MTGHAGRMLSGRVAGTAGATVGLVAGRGARRIKAMAKYRHRVFEMYDFLDEAIRALTPKWEYSETETAPELWTLRHLAVSRSALVTHVKFQGATTFADETLSDLRDDFEQLADRLDKDSKVVLDFTGVALFNPAAIQALTQFNDKLRTRGSRMVLCSLDPAARDCFFAAR